MYYIAVQKGGDNMKRISKKSAISNELGRKCCNCLHWEQKTKDLRDRQRGICLLALDEILERTRLNRVDAKLELRHAETRDNYSCSKIKVDPICLGYNKFNELQTY
jgi:hypothetical protein